MLFSAEQKVGTNHAKNLFSFDLILKFLIEFRTLVSFLHLNSKYLSLMFNC